MKLSHSAVEKLNTCGKLYDWHYNHKIRPSGTTSALFFGSAFDKAIESILLKKEEDPYEVFLKHWYNAELNKVPVYLPTCPDIKYFAKDFDPDILDKEDFEEIENICGVNYDYNDILAKRDMEGLSSFDPEELSYYLAMNWVSLAVKGRYLIESFKTEILPQITKVHAVQKEVKGDNGEGDTIIGFIDAIVDIKDQGKTILDIKTSSAPYKLDKAKTSPQLALYTHLEGINTVGFAVLVKSLKRDKIKTCKSCGYTTSSTHTKCNAIVSGKRCGGEWTIETKIKAAHQLMIEQLDEKDEEVVINLFDNAVTHIKSGVFEKNLSACNNMFGARCPYYGLCFNGDMHGLLQIKEEDKNGQK